MRFRQFIAPLVGAGVVAVPVVGISESADATSNERADGPATVGDVSSTADGTFEACSAYFGFGKVDLVSFDVAVDPVPVSGTPPMVGDGVDVVLVLENGEGAELRCVPEEITEEEWDAYWGTSFFIGAAVTPPEFPGAGHYAYPPQPAGLDIPDFGVVENVGFEVTAVPADFQLVAPAATRALPATLSIVTPDQFIEWLYAVDTLLSPPSATVLAYVTAQAGADAAQALTDLFDGCQIGDTSSVDADDFAAALAVFAPFYDVASFDLTDICDGLLLAGFLTPVVETAAAADVVEVIEIAQAPVVTTTTTAVETLPETGSQHGGLAQVAAGLVAFGAAIIGATRRRARNTAFS